MKRAICSLLEMFLNIPKYHMRNSEVKTHAPHFELGNYGS